MISRHSASRPKEGRENESKPQAIYQTGKKVKSPNLSKDHPNLKGSKHTLSPKLTTAGNWPLTKIQHDKRKTVLTCEMKVKQASRKPTREKTQSHTNVPVENLKLEES